VNIFAAFHPNAILKLNRSDAVHWINFTGLKDLCQALKAEQFIDDRKPDMMLRAATFLPYANVVRSIRIYQPTSRQSVRISYETGQTSPRLVPRIVLTPPHVLA
jgi:hypothetical protein